MTTRLEKTILSNLIHSEDYCRKVVPFLKTEYFSDNFERIVAQELLTFFTEYNKPASLEILAIQIGKRKLHKDQIESIEKYINDTNFFNNDDNFSSINNNCRPYRVLYLSSYLIIPKPY